MPLPVILKRLLNLLRVLVSVPMVFSFAVTFAAVGFFTLEPSRRAFTGICREVDTFLEEEAVVCESFALGRRISLMD